MTNIRFSLILLVLVCSILGIYTFHAKITCRSSPNKKVCVRRSFLFTVAVILVAAAVVTLYYIHTNRQRELDDMIDTFDPNAPLPPP